MKKVIFWMTDRQNFCFTTGADMMSDEVQVYDDELKSRHEICFSDDSEGEYIQLWGGDEIFFPSVEHMEEIFAEEHIEYKIEDIV
jgi:hypothetical protein